jgi:hypothetical protein
MICSFNYIGMKWSSNLSYKIAIVELDPRLSNRYSGEYKTYLLIHITKKC